MTTETVADYDVRSPASRTVLAVIGTLVVVGVIVGLLMGASALMRETKVIRSVVDLGESTQLVVKATSADIRVVEGDTGVLSLTARVTSGLRKTDFQIGRRGDEIKVVSVCQPLLSPGCGVALTISVPKGMPVVISTTSGDIAAEAIAKGVFTASSTSGDIVGRALAVDEFSATSRSGDIRAVFAGQPFGFKARTDSGDIAATIPPGKRAYAVITKSTSGDVVSQFESTEGGDGLIRATSDSGDIRLLAY